MVSSGKRKNNKYIIELYENGVEGFVVFDFLEFRIRWD